MGSKTTIEMNDVTELFGRLQTFQYEGLGIPLGQAAKKLAYRLRDNISNSRNNKGGSYPLIKQVTNEMEIARSGPYSDSRKRQEVSSNPNAMNVTGRTEQSIKSERVSYKEFTVGVDDPRSQIVLESNARNPGSVNKPKRDPLGLSDNSPADEEIDIVEDYVSKAIEGILNGF
jgi:hypothetical protein